MKIFLLLFLISFNALAGPGTFPKGPVVKMLKNTLEGKTTQTRIYTGDSDDPTAVAKFGDIGSLYIRGTSGELYQKRDGGSSTNWQNLLIGPVGNGTDECVSRWDGTGSPSLQDSLFCITDVGFGTGLTGLDVDNLRLDGNSISSQDVNGDITLDPNGIGKVVVNSDLDILGTVTQIAISSLAVTNATILVNNGGNQATADAQDAGLIVGMSDAIDAQLGYDSTCATRFQSGEVGSLDCTVNETVTQTLTNKTIDADSNTITNIENADIKVGAAIDRAKLASGTANHVIINNGSGVMSSEALLANSRGGTGLDSSASTGVAKVAAGVWSVSALDLTTDVTGILPIANGGTNSSTALNNDRIMVSSGGSIVEAAALTNGQMLVGSTGAAPVAAALTATANQTTVTNGVGSITLGTVQDIGTVSSPSFTGLTLSGLTQNSVIFAGVGGVLTEDNTNFTFTVGTGALDVNGSITVDNLSLNGNTISSTDVNGNIIADANGTGQFNLADVLLMPHLADPAGSPAAGNSNLYFKSDEILHDKDENGVVNPVNNRNTPDVLTNMSFEKSYAGSPALGWTYTPSGADVATVETTEVLAGNGTQAVSITPAAETFTFDQTFNCDQYDGMLVQWKASVKSANANVEVCSLIGAVATDCVAHNASGSYDVIGTEALAVAGSVCGIRVRSTVAITDTVKIDAVEFNSSPKTVNLNDSATCYVKDTQASGVNGGSATANTVQVRNLDVTEGSCSFVSLATDQITLAASSTYKVCGWATGYEVSRHQVFWYSVTNTSYDIDGTSAVVAIDGTSTLSMFCGEVVTTAAEVFELRHWTQGTRAITGLGFAADNHASNPQTREIYAVISITKVQ